MCLFPDFGQPEFPEMCLFRILANSPSLARLNLQSSRCVAENNVPDNKSGIKPEFPEMCLFSDFGKQPEPGPAEPAIQSICRGKIMSQITKVVYARKSYDWTTWAHDMVRATLFKTG